MNALDAPVSYQVSNWIQWDQTGIYDLIDDRPRLITIKPDTFAFSKFDNERQEAKDAYMALIDKEIENNPFYEFFVSFEIVEKGKTFRIEWEYFRGCSYVAEVKPEDLRVEKPKRPLPTASLMGIYDIIIPFLNQIPYSDEAVVYADVISREDYTSRGIVQRRDYNGEYLYTAHS